MADRVVRRSVPQTLRRGLTFWRRSIQARVVVSTVLLSTVALVAVGWFLLRQVERGLVNHRVATVVREAGTENKAAHDRLAAIPFSDTDAARQTGELADSFVSSGLIAWTLRPGCLALRRSPPRGASTSKERWAA